MSSRWASSSRSPVRALPTERRSSHTSPFPVVSASITSGSASHPHMSGPNSRRSLSWARCCCCCCKVRCCSMVSSLDQRTNLLRPALIAPLGLSFALRAFILRHRLGVEQKAVVGPVQHRVGELELATQFFDFRRLCIDALGDLLPQLRQEHL